MTVPELVSVGTAVKLCGDRSEVLWVSLQSLTFEDAKRREDLLIQCMFLGIPVIFLGKKWFMPEHVFRCIFVKLVFSKLFV